MAGDTVDLRRRGFLRGRPQTAPEPIRPPWSRPGRFADLCTRCGACADACPEAILHRGDGGYPQVDFARGECSFCGACADACTEPVFDRSLPAWSLRPAVAPSCLAARRVVCRSCQDACPESAIRFIPAAGGAAVARIADDACTGCGACVAACPTGAVTLHPSPPNQSTQPDPGAGDHEA
ncbi:ferredoxin-type protein NapF [Azospirillum picis]|uniref:Ferredoxin-type protein NapF n=1 Tax=Azospirillum picis TaxID=488438 RepID=A0ABU0MQK8_9PROT|nr:ferredoxin-type protein NapF [Azospirillum picis]MBP2302187.1 ferredoxin-type protein NapF [Azospirillum picis]MDQ0535766.1 ferredoxin-type protein NapF [Azospirillum picis]